MLKAFVMLEFRKGVIGGFLAGIHSSQFGKQNRANNAVHGEHICMPGGKHQQECI